MVDEIVIHSAKNDRLICFKQSLGKNIEENWYQNRQKNIEQEKLRLVELAAHQILQDIRSMKFNEKNVYKSPSTFLNDLDKDIPKSLKLLLDILIKTHKHAPKNNSWVQWDNKIITIAHIIMSCVRPRSFSSSILLALSSMIHKKFCLLYTSRCV